MLSIGDATQAAKNFQELAAAATNDGDVEKAIIGFTNQIEKATGGAELTGSDLQVLQSGFESLGLGKSDFEQNIGLSRGFQNLSKVSDFSALSALMSFQQADSLITFNIQMQESQQGAPPPPMPDGLGVVVDVAQGTLNPGHPLAAQEVESLTEMRAFGHEDFGGKLTDGMFGEDVTRLKDCACFSWALAGASDALVNPAPIFGMLGNNGLMTSVEAHIRDVKDAPTQMWLSHAGNTQAIEEIKDDIIGLEVNADEAIERATKLMIEANGMEVVEDSDFSICMEYSMSDTMGVNFTHWGIQFMGQTLETNPGVGFWKTNDTFADNWSAVDGSTRVVTIPVRAFTSAHNAVIRDVLQYNPDA
jgi:hypothetical protein